MDAHYLLSREREGDELENLADSHHAALADSNVVGTSHNYPKTISVGLPLGISHQDMTFSWKVMGYSPCSAPCLGGVFLYCEKSACHPFGFNGVAFWNNSNDQLNFSNAYTLRNPRGHDLLCEGLWSKGSNSCPLCWQAPTGYCYDSNMQRSSVSTAVERFRFRTVLQTLRWWSNDERGELTFWDSVGSCMERNLTLCNS